MNFAAFIDSSWTDHATDADAVFSRLPEGLRLAETGSDLGSLSQLAAHVAGEHLGRWHDGIAFLKQCQGSSLVQPQTPEYFQIARNIAILAFCNGDTSHVRIGSPSDKIRILAPAAAAFVGQKRTEDAMKTLKAALYLASYGPDKQDFAARALAISGNNIATQIEELPTRTNADRALMIAAAETARHYWEVAGTWIEVERAEYRLAMTFIAAGDATRALKHASLCHDICEDNNAVPYEKFYAHEGLVKAQLAASQPAIARLERDQAAALVERMKEDVQAECREALTNLDRLLGLA